MELTCPLPLNYQQIVMAHGGGGRLMQQLLTDIIQPIFNNSAIHAPHDSASLMVGQQRLAFTTDSYVINPLIFKGGDIGKLAVCGTVNDLAMSGATPLFLSCALIIEEGLAIHTLETILNSMQSAASQAGVCIVTGDTKVVDNGKGDCLYINTAGIGILENNTDIHAGRIALNDAVIISGDIARHGIAIMLAREGLDFESDIVSDCALLSPLVADLINAGITIHCLRDLTRGGLASCLIELASASDTHIQIEESAIIIQPPVASACELLGFDPLYIANEGCFALFLPKNQVSLALSILQKHAAGQYAAHIGAVKEAHGGGLVTLNNAMGITRVLNLLSGEQLPRIC